MTGNIKMTDFRQILEIICYATSIIRNIKIKKKTKRKKNVLCNCPQVSVNGTLRMNGSELTCNLFSGKNSRQVKENITCFRQNETWKNRK